MLASPTPVDQAREYDRYIVGSVFVYWVDDLLDRAAVQPGERVLDVACGTGIVARTLAKRMGGAVSISALDLNPAMITVAEDLAATGGVAIDWTQGSALELPYPDDIFDVVLCEQGLQFMPDKAKAVTEMRRVLRPGGRAVISVWQGYDVHPFAKAMNDSLEKWLGLGGVDRRLSWGDATLFSATLLDAGFQNVSMDALSKPSRYPEPDRYVQNSLLARAAVTPELRNLDPGTFQRAVELVAADMAGLVAEATEGDYLVVPSIANIATAS